MINMQTKEIKLVKKKKEILYLIYFRIKKSILIIKKTS